MEPEHACALITDERGWLLFELRPATARHAPSQLTCFGGKREYGEGALACLRRELHEELGWAPASAEPCCDLRRGERFIARFFRATLPPHTTLRIEAGALALWAPWPALDALPISPWHVAVLAAVRAGRTSARC
jgi:8-oxo-dGTP pyrophosphatase MutT (NUDIX family)